MINKQLPLPPFGWVICNSRPCTSGVLYGDTLMLLMKIFLVRWARNWPSLSIIIGALSRHLGLYLTNCSWPEVNNEIEACPCRGRACGVKTQTLFSKHWLNLDSLKKRGDVLLNKEYKPSDTFQVGVLGTHLGSCLSLHKIQILYSFLLTCLDVVLGYTVTLISFSAKCFCFRKHFCIELCRRTSFCLLVEKTLEKSLSCTMFLNCDVGVLVILWPIYFFSIEYIFRLHKSANYNWFFYCATC